MPPFQLTSTIDAQQISSATGLFWGLHENFRHYISRMSDGEYFAAEGAVKTDSGQTVFPATSLSESENELARFAGSMNFQGHRGMLAVRIANPAIVVGNENFLVTIDDPFPGPEQRMSVVQIMPDGTTALTEAGTDLFMGNYPQGTVCDPVYLSTDVIERTAS